MWSNGNSFGDSTATSITLTIGTAGKRRWPVPSWKFGLRQSDDRGNM